MTSSTRFDPDALAALESERDFLLRSLTDLEEEREAGNLDDDRALVEAALAAGRESPVRGAPPHSRADR